ncbi:type IV pilus secretin PilQ [Eleftheria terrae]|uniref:type IV pilus secretin PilQ n=1 Tax=Eleftheria terrae TaxID=1597781 RepID=UPI00263B0392|nr:type IV pilus secretin PilQ [Eleftheria terrae]WKB55202.1 type IV pilus secretin PilQ [Eleftheria terrae]
MFINAKTHPLRRAALGLSLLVAPVLAWAQNAIQSINSSQQSGAEVVRIELSQPLAAVPSGFTIQSPPRIAIDLPGVTNAMGRSSIELNQGNLRSASVAQAGERTRLVLNLKQASNYTAQLQGKTLLLVLENGGVAAAQSGTQAKSEQPVHFAESMNRNQLALKDVDFRRGQDNAGRVVVELPNNQVGVDIRQQGQSLVVEFLRSTLPENLRRRLDVTDFGTPVQTVTTSQSGDRVRMVVEPRGNWEHSAYQTDTQFVLEVRPQKQDPNKLVQGPGFQGEKLSLNFQNIEVRALLQVIADFTNFNVVTSDTVAGNVTLRLKDVPWDQALDIILQAKGLGMRKSGNVLWIAPKDEIATKEKLDLEAKQQVTQLEPLRTQSFQLNYTKAEEVTKGLLGQTGGISNAKPMLTPRGSVIFEARTNQIFVTDIPSKLEEVQQLISKIDIPVRQVMIEARIVEANDNFGRQLGVRLGSADLRGIRGGTPGWGVGSGDSRVAVTGTYMGVGEQTVQAEKTGGSYVPNTYFVNLPAQAVSGTNPASFALSLFSSSANRFLNLELSALEADRKGKVVSSPRVITADQVKALIEQGTELPYQVATSSGATSIAWRKANLKLEVTPQITPEGNIILDVDINKDSVGQTTPAGLAINTKHVQTQVLIENGGTVVIGGIFEQEERDEESKVPLLGDVPVLGHLFKTKGRVADKTELLVFLTPRVISDRTAVR